MARGYLRLAFPAKPLNLKSIYFFFVGLLSRSRRIPIIHPLTTPLHKGTTILTPMTVFHSL